MAAIFCSRGKPMTNNVTRRLAEFLVDSQWKDIPDKVRHAAKRTILNFAGTALGGCRDEAEELAIRGLGAFFGPPQATVIGRSERPDALSAAFLNAISANVLEFEGHQAGVWLCQGALSRAEEEHPSPTGDLRAGQSVHGAPATIGLPKGVMCLQPDRQPRGRPNTASTPPNRPVSYSPSKSPCPRTQVPDPYSDVP